MFDKITLYLGAVFIVIGIFIVFFGGNWELTRIVLEIIGAVWLFKLAYSVIAKDREEKQKQEEVNKIAKKYFEDD